MTTDEISINLLPAKLYRGLLMLTCAWPGQRVNPNSLLIKVHEPKTTTHLPLIWCGGPPELETIISVCGKERTIYGLRGTYDFVEPTDEVVCSLSQYYADEIERAIPTGTYLIAGYCAAAYLALEIANLLIARGHQIGFLAMIERDVTEKNYLLSFARRVFNRIDLHGTRFYEALNTLQPKTSVMTYIKSAPKIVTAVVKADNLNLSDPRRLIKVESESQEKMYELKAYPKQASLFFIRWGVFGFYQMRFFQKYWRKIVNGGMTVDFIPGYSHKYPNWARIIQKLDQRLKETGH